MKDYRIAPLSRFAPEAWSKHVLKLLYEGYSVQVPPYMNPWGVTEAVMARREENDRLKTHRSI